MDEAAGVQYNLIGIEGSKRTGGPKLVFEANGNPSEFLREIAEDRARDRIPFVHSVRSRDVFMDVHIKEARVSADTIKNLIRTPIEAAE